MTKKTQEEGKEAYLALSTEQRATCDTYLLAYRSIRLREGPLFYITREAVAEEQGSNSISGATKFMLIIEAMEGDQPRPRRGKKKQGSQDQFFVLQHPAAVENAFAGMRTALEVVSKAVMMARSAADADLSAHFQTVIREQQTVFESDRQADELRIEDLEISPLLSATNAGKLDRVSDLVDQVHGHEAVVDAINGRHEADRASIQSACDRQLAEERQRSTEREAMLLQWFGDPGRRTAGGE